MSTIQIKSRIWVEKNDRVLLGQGKVKLLKAVVATGSLTKAAKSMGISYNKAWHMVDQINKVAERPVILTQVGGTSGGGSSLTAFGQILIDTFEEVEQNCWKMMDVETEKFREL